MDATAIEQNIFFTDPSIMDTRLLNEIEVARITGRSRSTLQKDRFNRQGIPYVKMGRSVRYYLKDVRAYMREHRVLTD